MGVVRDGEKAESDVPFQEETHAWAQREPTKEHLEALKDPTIQEFLCVCRSAERQPVPPGELLPRERVISRNPCQYSNGCQ